LESQPKAPNPKDSYLQATAEAGQEDFLGTGDKEPLSIGHHKSTRIVTPAAMIEILKESTDSK
jgi:predicted nucleic acid-binding protein